MTIYYVSKSGLDTNDGSITSPWKTIQKAASYPNLKAGDTVYVREGIYKEKVTITKSGSENAYITFRNYDGETPVIDGANQPVVEDDFKNALILINNKSYIKVMGFKVTNYISTNSYVPAGIRVVGASKNIEIRNCKVDKIQTTYNKSTQNRNAHGIAVHGTDGENSLDGLVIDSCEVCNCILGQSESLVLNGNVTSFKVSNNKIHDNDNIGIDFIGYESTAINPDGLVSDFDYARDGECSGNEIWNISSGSNKTYEDKCADGIYVDGGSSILIEGNKVWNTDIGIETASEHKGKATDNVIVRNNLVYNCSLYGISIGGYSRRTGNSTNIKIYNNTVYNNDINMNIQRNCQFYSNIIRNNIFYKGTPYYGNKSNIVISNNITSNPKFVTEGGDFHLKDGSPAIDKGFYDKADPTIVSAIGSVDLDGNPRIVGVTVDCGCYEKQ